MSLVIEILALPNEPCKSTLFSCLKAFRVLCVTVSPVSSLACKIVIDSVSVGRASIENKLSFLKTQIAVFIVLFSGFLFGVSASDVLEILQSHSTGQLSPHDESAVTCFKIYFKKTLVGNYVL